MIPRPRAIDGGRVMERYAVTMHATTSTGRYVTKNFRSDVEMYFWLKHIQIKAGTLRVVRR